MQAKIATIHDRKSFLDFIYEEGVENDYPIEIFESMVKTGMPYIVYDGPKVVGALGYEIDGWDANILMFLVHKDYLSSDVPERLMQFIENQRLFESRLIVRESNLPMQIMLRDKLGYICTTTDDFTYDNESGYIFKKVHSKKKEEVKV